jgi:prepilin-type N-terminal cleavage/methylation domain-containing protein
MRNRLSSRGFTIIELLVVVSIIALLVGILLPAIGKAREQAQLTKSQSNVSNLGKAAVTYAAEFADRQLTYIDDGFSRYGSDGATAVTNFGTTTGYDHNPVILGYGQGGIWGFFLGPQFGTPGNYVTIVPIDFNTKFGAFRIVNGRQFNQYLNGRFYDPIFYAPKDSAVVASVEQWFDHPDEYVPSSLTGGQKWSSYCFSPAAMFSPDVLGLNKTTQRYYNDPYALPAGFRSPAMSQARFPDLKTHIIEHHWCQNRKKTCNPFFAGGVYDGCQPFFFNGSWDSAPVALFYDGHIEAAGQRDAIDANSRICAQNGQPSQGQNAYKGLWSVDTPMGGTYADYSGGGYYMDAGLDWSSTSYHVLTIDGIRGRDFIAK